MENERARMAAYIHISMEDDYILNISSEAFVLYYIGIFDRHTIPSRDETALPTSSALYRRENQV